MNHANFPSSELCHGSFSSPHIFTSFAKIMIDFLGRYYKKHVKYLAFPSTLGAFYLRKLPSRGNSLVSVEKSHEKY